MEPVDNVRVRKSVKKRRGTVAQEIAQFDSNVV